MMNDIIFSSWQGRIIDNRGKDEQERLPVDNIKLPLEFQKDKKILAFMGWDGLVIRDEGIDPFRMAVAYLEALQKTSCGKCFPCRVGARLLLDILVRIRAGQGQNGDREKIIDLGKSIMAGSKCSIGQTGPLPILHTMEYFVLPPAGGTPALPDGKVEYLYAVTAPCVASCPSSLDIPRYTEEISEGKFTDSLCTIKADTCMPGTLGRVCVRPCESNCRRANIDEAVSIKYLKRYAADRAVGKKSDPIAPFIPDKRQKIAVIGAGPAGLSSAYYLARMGYQTVIFEKLEEPGGMAAVGIPDYRLPRDILRREVDQIVKAGVEIRYGVNVGKDVTLAQLAHDYDAVFIGVGAHNSSSLGAKGEDMGYLGFIPGVKYLLDVNLGRDPYPEGKKVVVVGGGNTAIDGVRASFRLGKTDVNLVYRRSKAEMPADPVEIHDAEEEGVNFHYLCNPVRILAENNRVTGIECIRMELGEPDQSGRRRPVPVPGSEFIIETDILVPAIGQAVDLSFLTPQDGIRLTKWNSIDVNEVTFETSRPGIFAAGDCATGPDVLVRACGNGRKAARMIDRYLMGLELTPENEESFLSLFNCMNIYDKRENLGIIGGLARKHLKMLPPESRKFTFDEVEEGFRTDEAIYEASRCLRCYRVGLVAVGN
ncbi:MAG: FAD-dependent oxidoreductase [Smithellaceae bacterium]|nr:FAD-dependent oxidoreductase [Smithellaceae bacterium]